MTNAWLLKLIFSLTRACRSGKESDEYKPNVAEEYQQAFRTNSYLDICNKAQGKLGNTSSFKTLSSSTSSSLPICFMRLTEYLLEPRQETVTNMSQSLNVHHLLLEYFEASLEASHYCDRILQAVHQTRLTHQKISRVVKQSKTMLDCTDTDHNVNDQTHKAIYRDLASFSLQNNPFSVIQFRDIHNTSMALLRRLKSKGAKIRRKVAFKGICKKVGGIGVVVSYSALLIALVVLVLHSIVGIVAAPCVVMGLVGLLRKRVKWVERRINTRNFERLCEQLDAAAKGVYILINDFDTMSRMVKRLQDEVEHRQAVADMCVRNGKCEILKQVFREFREHESGFLDQLEELEEHVYLCFLTINRSRRLVVQEIMEKQR